MLLNFYLSFITAIFNLPFIFYLWNHKKYIKLTLFIIVILVFIITINLPRKLFKKARIKAEEKEMFLEKEATKLYSIPKEICYKNYNLLKFQYHEKIERALKFTFTFLIAIIGSSFFRKNISIDIIYLLSLPLFSFLVIFNFSLDDIIEDIIIHEKRLNIVYSFSNKNIASVPKQVMNIFFFFYPFIQIIIFGFDLIKI